MFDHMGRTVSVRDNEGNAVFGGYKDTDEQKNMLKYSSNMQSRIDNLLKNPIAATADYWR